MIMSRLLRLFPSCLLLAIPVAASAVEFQEGWHLGKGANSADVKLVDIDLDGDLDAYVTESNGADRLWINDGQGVYSLSPQALDTAYGLGADLGLLDGDAYPDLFLSRQYSPSSVWLNDGAGTLLDSGQTLGSEGNTSHIALGFLNNDAYLDAFLLTNGGPNQVLFNDGNGVFTDSGQTLGNGQSLDVVLVDVGEDGNGDIDAIVANNGVNRVWFNDGNGVFTDSGETLNSNGSFEVGVGYLNNDAILDIFFANGVNGGTGNTVFFGDGDGTFTKDSQSLGHNYSVSVAIYDFDGQNGPDAFVGNNSGEMDRLWLNDGSGNFADSGQTLGVGAAFGLDIGLINDDAHMDVIIANRYQPDQVWLGDGTGGFTNSGQSLGSFLATGMAIADIDGDNDLDAVFGAIGGTARVFVNDGDGNFSDTNQWLVTGQGNNASEIAMADLDGDNDVDIYIGATPQSTSGSSADRIFLNDGSGVFTDSGQLIGGENTGAVAIGDLNGDDEPDVFVGNSTQAGFSNSNHILFNNGGILTQSPQNLGGQNTQTAALVDLDHDGDLDIFIGNIDATLAGGGYVGAQNRIYLNGEGNGGTDPEGVFFDSGQSLGVSRTFAVAFGLINDDEHVDMFVGNDGANEVWINDGSGNFTDSGQQIGNDLTRGVHLFDADNDGDMDAFTTNGGSYDGPSKIWINDGDGNFTDSGLDLGIESKTTESAMDDLDGDGQPDVLVSNLDGDIRVWLNKTAVVLQQKITPLPVAQTASIGDAVAIDIAYSTSDGNESVSGLGFRLHWNSSKLTFVNLSSVWNPDLVTTDSSCQADGANYDSDPNTDCYIEAVWANGGNDFPGTGNIPTPLYSANFTANIPLSQTTFVKFSASNLAPGYSLNANTAAVTNPDNGLPEFESTPAASSELNFGNVSTTGVSAPQFIAVTNSGSGPLTLDCYFTSGNENGDFEISLCPSPIAAGATTQIQVLCTPVSRNLRIATLSLTTNDADEQYVNYPLSCSGIWTPEFSSDPAPGTSLNFGSVDVGTTSNAIPIELSNLGDQPGMQIISCSLSGDNADQFQISLCPNYVYNSSPETINVTCKPTSTGALTASLDMVTNDPDKGNVSWPLSCNELVTVPETIYADGFEAPDL